MLFCQAIIVISNMLMDERDRAGGDARFLHELMNPRYSDARRGIDATLLHRLCSKGMLSLAARRGIEAARLRAGARCQLLCTTMPPGETLWYRFESASIVERSTCTCRRPHQSKSAMRPRAGTRACELKFYALI